MPVKIPAKLPATQILANENIFVMDEKRALTQDIRPLKILILNLMPTKETTETQLLRLLGNTPLQIEPVFLATGSYRPTHTTRKYLDTFYRTFDEIKDQKFDGCIITGAPVELMDFEAVQYWDELTKIMKWTSKNVYSTLHICWGAQAGLYYRYGIPKYLLKQKCFGIFSHRLLRRNIPLTQGFDDIFNAPHSRHTTVKREDIEKHEDLMILAESKEAGVYLIADNKFRHVYVMGHSEYDRETLEIEYLRDLDKGLEVDPPENYYHNTDPKSGASMVWRSHANLLFSNWLNYCVYQETPYDINLIDNIEDLG